MAHILWLVRQGTGNIIMGLSKDQRRYLKAFEEETHRKGSSGWLECGEAAKQSKVDDEGGRLALRLEKRGYLVQRRKGEPDFSITPRGIGALHPWKDRRLITTIIIAVIGWGLLLLTWLLGH